ncbi:MAG: DUF2585 family protein, partial [Zymomonas sp.]
FMTPERSEAAKPSLGACALLMLLVNGAAAGLLWLFGRSFLPRLEPLRLWSAGFEEGANSQHLSDPYSFMHGVFGAGLYLFIDRLKPGWSTRAKLMVAVIGSAVWEIVENTPPVIRLFNESGQPGAYAGDSIVNSMSDTGCVILGFFVAQLIGWRATLVLAILIEVVLSLTIGDGLLLGALKVLGLV